MVKIVHLAMSNIVIVGFLGYLVIVLPIIGIMAAHESEKPK